MRGLLKVKKLIVESLDQFVVSRFTEVYKCQLCSQFLVMVIFIFCYFIIRSIRWMFQNNNNVYLNVFYKTARNSCCEPCLMNWMNEDDPEDEVIKCRSCNTPIKAVLSGRELIMFYVLIEYNDRKISKEVVICMNNFSLFH